MQLSSFRALLSFPCPGRGFPHHGDCRICCLFFFLFFILISLALALALARLPLPSSHVLGTPTDQPKRHKVCLVSYSRGIPQVNCVFKILSIGLYCFHIVFSDNSTTQLRGSRSKLFRPAPHFCPLLMSADCVMISIQALRVTQALFPYRLQSSPSREQLARRAVWT